MTSLNGTDQLPQSDDSDVVEVPLQNSGRPALIDAADWPRVKQYRWYARSTKKGDVIAEMRYELDEYDLPGPSLPLHNFILLGLDHQGIVSHIDGNRLNNRRSNLRQITRQELGLRAAAHNDGKSPYKGVWQRPATNRSGATWTAQLRIGGKNHSRSGFAKDWEAAFAYDDLVREFAKPGARLNFPELDERI